MKVVQFCPDDLTSSGINKFCTELDRHLRQIGVESRILRAFEPAELERIGGEGQLLIHVHDMWLPSVHRVAAWARKHQVPLVWSTHGMTAPWSMRHKWWKKLPAWWLYQKRDLHRAAAIHCTTDLEVEWNRHYGFRNCFVIPLGTDLVPIHSVNPSISQSPNPSINQSVNPSIRQSVNQSISQSVDPLSLQSPNQTIPKSNNQTIFRVLFVGRIYPVKGLMNLVRAAALLKDGVERSVKFRLVGPDQAGHQAELEAECRRLGVDNVEFAGEKSGAELAAEYDACDVLVLPSFTENFGGVVVDALAHGKPVIASRFTPWRELVAEGCGWWVGNSPESLAKTIEDVVHLPPEQLVQMSMRGRHLVEQRYTWDAVARKMKSEYERVVGRMK